MSQSICTRDGCDERVLAQSLCVKHYHRGRRSGEVVKLESSAQWHRLTEVDEDAQTATCAVCGPASPIRVRGPGRGNECRTKADARSGKYRPQDSRRRKHRLTREQYDALVVAAAGRCGICDVELGDDFHLDHCHETGRVRGLLCKRCNIAIGWLDDSPARALAAHMYLKSHGKADSA